MGIESRNISFSSFAADIHKGHLIVPEFQRDFIWNSGQVEEFLDSIYNEFPTGSILLWATKERLCPRDPLNLKLNQPASGSEVSYILDGQQRLVTLCSIFSDTLSLGKGKEKIKYRAYFNLKTRTFSVYKKDDIQRLSEKGRDRGEPKISIDAENEIPLSKLLEFNYDSKSIALNKETLSKMFEKHDFDTISIYQNLFSRFANLTLPTVTVSMYPLETACIIFERLNNTGTPLSVVDLMVAKTYKSNFNLRDKLNDTIEDLGQKDFEVDGLTILECCAACINNGISRRNILDSSIELEDKWDKIIEALKRAIDFLKSIDVKVYRFLPYDVFLSTFAHFFYNYNGKQTPDIIKNLKRYFWFSSLSERYIQAQNTRASSDIEEMDKLINESKGSYFQHIDKPKLDYQDIMNIDFNPNSALSKAIMCILSTKNPLEFRNNAPVNVGKTFSKSNTSEFHHIFPKKFIEEHYQKNTNFEKEVKPRINRIANIALISSIANKEIQSKSPKDYINSFYDANKEIRKSLNSHLIGDLKEFGIENEDFLKFLEERSKAILSEVNNIIKDVE